MKLTVNRGISLVLIFIAASYLIMAFQLPEYAFVPVDSDLIPKLLGACLLVLGICFFFAKDVDTEEQKKKRTIPKKRGVYAFWNDGACPYLYYRFRSSWICYHDGFIYSYLFTYPRLQKMDREYVNRTHFLSGCLQFV